MTSYQNNAADERDDPGKTQETPPASGGRDPGILSNTLSEKNSQGDKGPGDRVPGALGEGSFLKGEGGAVPIASPAPKLSPKKPGGAKREMFGEHPLEPDFQKPTDEGDGIVSFVMFNRKYHVRTDKPELIFDLAQIIHDHVREVREENESSALYDLDILTQAAFKLALKLRKALGGVQSLEENIETKDRKIQDLIDSIDKNL
jgi:cell division protein ZapA (FtsZ GTPase activity inhibitor)